jgi:hypothetical protein
LHVKIIFLLENFQFHFNKSLNKLLKKKIKLYTLYLKNPHNHVGLASFLTLEKNSPHLGPKELVEMVLNDIAVAGEEPMFDGES